MIPSFRSVMTFYCDKKRHLVCRPYSVDNLHKMAELFSIKRCWFHSGRLAHYDIPKRRVPEIMAAATVVSSREILNIIKGL